ncbi:MAG: DUF169 domain-containing protein [Thermotogota bacterium]|nr:DUF169 domain-containing protein [Thermotogota bacterium]
MTLKEMATELEQILRLDTRPVGIKMYEQAENLPKKAMPHKINICQIVSIARYQGRDNAGVPEKMICSMGAACVGLIKTTQAIASGKAAVGPYCKDEVAGKQFMANTYKIGDNGKKYSGIYAAALENSKEEPDVVVIYANPAQIMRLIHANTYDAGEKTTADTVAEAALCSSIGYALEENKPVIGFPCAGDRIFGGTQNQEMVFAAPFKLFKEKLIENLKKTAEGGFSVFPVPPNMHWTPAMPPTYTIQDKDLSE